MYIYAPLQFRTPNKSKRQNVCQESYEAKGDFQNWIELESGSKKLG